jgi:hypothetical protein
MIGIFAFGLDKPRELAVITGTIVAAYGVLNMLINLAVNSHIYIHVHVCIHI